MVGPLRSRITTLYLFIFFNLCLCLFHASRCRTSRLSVLFFTHPAGCMMTDSMMSKAATMEIPINSNGDTRTIAEDDGLEQVGYICTGSWWET